MAILVAYVKDHLRRNPGTDNFISVPKKHAYLQRMDFFRAVGADLPERFQRQDPTGRFVPVRELPSGASVPQTAEDIVATLRVDDPDAARTLRHCVGEIVDNVFVHALSPVNAIVCAQHFPNARRSQVAIVDTGIGFKASFAESPALQGETIGDRDALELGLLPFVTSKPQTDIPYENSYGRLGVGLFIVSEILDRIGGRILVVSGGAGVDRRGGRTRWHRVKPWKGTIVGFEVPDEPLVAHDVAINEARQLARDRVRSAQQRDV